MGIDDFINNALALDANSLIVEAAGLKTNELADLNRQNLSKGVLASGDSTEDYASISYANYKSSIGSKSVPNMDFKLTGALHEGIFFKTQGDKIEKGSTDSKADKIAANWGDDVFGVTDSNLIDTIDPVLPKIIDKKLMK